MNLGYTLHRILRAKNEALPIGVVESFSDTEYADLLPLGAIRVPTDDEVALYRLHHPEPVKEIAHVDADAPVVEASKPVKTGKGGKNAGVETAPVDPAVTEPDLI